MQTLLGFNLIFNIGALYGVSSWLESGDPFIFTSFYYFYWVTLCLSFIISFVSLFFSNTDDTDDTLLFRKQFISISFILAVLWTGASFGLTFLLNECISSQLECHGEMISITFSYPLAFLWTAFFVFSLRRHKFYDELNSI